MVIPPRSIFAKFSRMANGHVGMTPEKILKSRVKRARGTNFKNYFKKNFFEEHKNTVIFLMKTVKKYANYTQKTDIF